jgi:hypothetical protein
VRSSIGIGNLRRNAGKHLARFESAREIVFIKSPPHTAQMQHFLLRKQNANPPSS